MTQDEEKRLGKLSPEELDALEAELRYIESAKRSEQAEKDYAASLKQSLKSRQELADLIKEDAKRRGEVPELDPGVDLPSPLPEGQLPTMYNQETGQWEEVDPTYSRYRFAIPLGPPRSSEEPEPQGGGLLDPTPWIDRGAQVSPILKRFASNEPGVPAGYEPVDNGTTTAWATTFGYNDPIDNGVGAWGDNTNNPYLVGVSLPIHELRRRFGDDDAAHGKLVQVTNAQTGASIVAPIVDKGPANWVINRQGPTIDLTEGARRSLGTGGKTPVTYAFVGDEYADRVTGPLLPAGYEEVPAAPLPEGYEEVTPPLPEGYEEVTPEAQPTPAAPAKKPYFATREEEERMGGKGPNYPTGEEQPTPTPTPTPTPAPSPTPGITYGPAYQTTAPTMPAQQGPLGPPPAPAPLAGIKEPSVEARPAKRQVGISEDIGRSFAQKIGEYRRMVEEKGVAPALELIDSAAQSVAPGTELSKFISGIKNNYQDLLSEKGKEEEGLKFDEKTEQRSLIGEVSGALARLAIDLPVIAATAEAFPLRAGAGVMERLGHGAGVMTIPGAMAGKEAADAVKAQGGSAAKQAKAFITTMAEINAMGAVPLSVEGKVLTRAAKAIPLASATTEGMRDIHNIVAKATGGDYQPFDIREHLVGAAPLAILGTAMGRRPAPIREFKSPTELPPDVEKPPTPPEEFAPKEAAAPEARATTEAPPAAPTIVQRTELPGVKRAAADKTHGIYTSPGDVVSPHAELGGETHYWELNPEAKVLDLTGSPPIPLRARAIDSGTGVHAAAKLVPEVAELLSRPRYTKADVVALGEKLFPGPNYKRYYDHQEVIEAIGAQAARKEGYDILKRDDPGDPAFNEYVLLTKNAATEIEKPAAKTRAPYEPIPEEATVGLVPPGTGKFVAGIEIAKGLLPRIASEMRIKKLTPFLRILNAWGAGNQANHRNTKAWVKEINARVPDPVKREGIVNYIEANGDLPTLAAREAASKNKHRKGYRAAQQLTSDEIDVANEVIQKYKDAIDEARKWGIEIPEAANYVTHLWKGQKMRSQNVRSLSDYFQFSRARVFPDYFTGEQKGYVPESKDIGELQGSYLLALGQSINNRKFVEALSKGLASDGRRLLWPKGIFRTVDQDNSKVHLIFPNQATRQMVLGPKGEMVPIETSDYKTLQIPGLQNWRWVGEADGNPVFMKSDLAVHPEIYDHLRKVLGNSMLRDWWNRPSDNVFHQMTKGVTRFVLDDFQRSAKETMFGFLSPFHQVQEGTHGVGHRINPFFNIPQIDFSNPEHSYAARMGLMLSPDRTSQNSFREGLSASSHNVATMLMRGVGRRLGKVGKPLEALAGFNDRYQDYLFEGYIPGLKYKMFEHAFQRNLNRFRKQLASGELTRDDVAHHTALQANAAFGHLNYSDLGRSPTVQHLMQISLLAPDFLEARAKFMGQALKGFMPIRGARPSAIEQLSAIALLAAVQYGATRIINGLLNEGDMHLTDHPFEIVHGNRVYYLRSVPEDFYKLLKDYKAFINGRLSPVIGRTLWREISGINHRGESVDLGQTIQSVIANFVPMSLQPFTRGLTEETRNNPVSWWEQMLGAMGIRIQRFSPVGEIYPLAEKWMERNAPESVQRGTFPTSKYTPMRYGLEDSDPDEVGNEVLYLIDKHKMTLQQIHDGFKSSNFKSFTNSQANDYRLYRSLDPEDQKMFEAALERRELIWKRFTTWVSKKPESKSGKEQLEAMRKAWLEEEKTKPKLPLKL